MNADAYSLGVACWIGLHEATCSILTLAQLLLHVQASIYFIIVQFTEIYNKLQFDLLLD
jgi:hypothetical protein